MIILLCFILFAGSAHAALDVPPVLNWDYNTTQGSIPATAMVQRSTTVNGTFATVATISSLPSTWPLPATADNLWYRIANAGGVSNVVQYVAIPVTTVIVGPAGPQGPQGIQGIPGTPADMTRVLALEARVFALEQAASAPVANISATVVNPDQITVTGLRCLSLKTAGTGLQRTITCVH